MEVRVYGRGVQITERIRSYAGSKVDRSARYFDRLGIVEVNVVKVVPPSGTQRFRAEMVTHSARHRVSAEGEGDTVHRALDAAGDRFANQLRRLGERLTDRRRQRSKESVGSPPADGVRPAEDGLLEEMPEIVRVGRPAGKPMSPEDAALVMDEHHYSFLVFTNSETGCVSVLYRRNDGRLGLIEAS